MLMHMHYKRQILRVFLPLNMCGDSWGSMSVFSQLKSITFCTLLQHEVVTLQKKISELLWKVVCFFFVFLISHCNTCKKVPAILE